MNTIRLQKKVWSRTGFVLVAALFVLLSFGWTRSAAIAAPEALPHKAVEAGDRSSFVVKKDGSLWAWGQNSNKLGLGSNQSTIYETPVKVNGISNVTAVSMGTNHTLAVKSDGTVWAWGSNETGALGLGSETRESNVPQQVKGPGGEGFLTDVADIAVGSTFSLALKKDGTVWQWGFLHTFQSATPVPVAGENGQGSLSGIARIEAGSDFALALKNDGTVLQWGSSFYVLPSPSATPQKVQGLEQVKAIGHGSYHALAVRSDGTVWAWGMNGSGQLGDGSKSESLAPVQVKLPGGEPLRQAKAVAGASFTSYAVKEDGTVWAWGDSNSGMLGIGEVGGDLYFGSPYALQVKGEGGAGFLEQVTSLSGSETTNFVLAAKSDGTFSGWGKNSEKQLVNTAVDTYIVPVKLDIRDDATDTTPPARVMNVPADGAVNVAVDAAVKVTFDKAVLAGPAFSGIAIADSNGLPVGGVTATVEERELTVAHAAFAPQQTYTVTIPAQAVKDAAGNANVGVIKWSFATAGPPAQSAQPLADKLSLRGVSLTGAQGAVTGTAVVKAYKLPDKQEPLETATADANGVFSLSLPAAVQTVYVTATETGKTESNPTAVSQTPVSAAAVSLYLPGGGTVGQDRTFEAEVRVVNYADLYGAQLQVKFDPAKLRLAEPAPIQGGDLWNGHSAAFFVNQDPARLEQGILTFAGTLRGEAAGLSGNQAISIAKTRFRAIGTPGTTAIDIPTDGVKLAAAPRGTSTLPIRSDVSGPASLTIVPGPAAGKATVSLAASAQEVRAGQPITVRVNVDKYTDVYGAQFQLAYDPLRLSVQDEDPGKPGVQVRGGSLFGTTVTQQVYNQVDVSQGVITFASMLRGGASGVSGSEPTSIAEITFVPAAHQIGDTSIALKPEHVKLAGYPSGDPASWQLPLELAGSPLLVKVKPAGPDTQAPVWPLDAKLTASGITSDAVTLKWTPASDDTAVSSYKIWKEEWTNVSVTHSVYGGGTSMDITGAVYGPVKQEAALVRGTQTEWKLGGLKSGTTYRFTVEAGDAAGHWSTGGPAVTVTTLADSGGKDTEAPRWPQGAKLEATSIGVNSVNLKWPTASDNTAVTAYRLYQGTTLLATVTGNVYEVTGLSSGTTYTFTVRAGDAAGNWSDELKQSFTTNSTLSSGTSYGACCGPAAPASFQITEHGIDLPQSYIRTTKETLAGAISSTLVTVDEEALGKAFGQLKDAAAAAQRITISVESAEPTVRLQLPVGVLVKAAADTPKAVIALEAGAGAVRYELPISQIGYEAIARELGADVKQMKLTLTMAAVKGAPLEQLKTGLKGMSLLSDAVEFTVTVEGGGKSRVVDQFNGTMVKRMFAIAEPDSSQITGVRFERTGPVFVPTLTKTIGGKPTAVLMSPTNSAYGVIKYRKTFRDTAGHWAQADVELLASKLVVLGTSEEHFAPDKDVTRAEFASLLVRSLGLPLSETAAPFKDVQAGDWFYGAVGTAVKAGLIEGFEDGTFQPEARITREQMAVMIARALKAADTAPKAGHAAALDAFRDKNAVSSWAKEALSQSLDTGLMNGMTESTLEPASHATRAQAAVMLKRLLRYAGYIN
ncbi:S-layer homology domain-containing protein [Paenibacillus tyrfis]|uniref:S-layer homology domain-containing protein n=1 Tax=Paenibacillus tyrfis TaxID=1501230 RepID=UPI00068ED581|nr:S-layer homology domain-containing protein [Paenibacillus tyrfis]